MKHSAYYCSLLLALGLAPLPVAAGTWSFTNVASDEDTGISPTKTYTHLVDLGADAAAATINGVKFTSKALTGANYSLVGPTASFVDNAQAPFADTGLGDY